MVESESELVVDTPDTLQEEMIAKSRVNEIVKREKAAAADKVRREMEAMHAQEVEKLKAAQQSPVGTSSQDSGMDMRAEVQRLLAEEVKKYQEEEEKRAREAELSEREKLTREAADKYLLQVSHGKSDFSDFDEVMQNYDMQAFPGIALLAGQMDNTAAIMYELAQNPTKVAQLHVLSVQSPQLAQKEMQKLSASIAKNQQAAANNVPTNAPLSRLKSSTVAGADNGQMGLKDYKNADWLKA